MRKLSLLLFCCILLCACADPYDGPENTGFLSKLNFDPLPGKIESTGKKTFMFTPVYMRWAAYDEEGERVKVGRASGGVDACPEDGMNCRTVVGEFQVERKGDATCVSKHYPLNKVGGGAPMAYCMYFHEGYAIHGSPGPVPQYPSSHGCIRVNIDDAQWLNEDFLTIGSRVVVQPYY